jgi:hypothetical protein
MVQLNGALCIHSFRRVFDPKPRFLRDYLEYRMLDTRGFLEVTLFMLWTLFANLVVSAKPRG